MNRHRFAHLGGLRRLDPARPPDELLLRVALAFQRDPAAPRMADIAAEVGCSRNAVRGLLRRALNEGILTVRANLPRALEREESLMQRWGLFDAVVVRPGFGEDQWPGQDAIRSALAPHVLACFESLVQKLVSSGSVGSEVRIGIDGGRTLFEAMEEEALFSLPQVKCRIHPLVLGPLAGTERTSSVVAHRLASRIGRTRATAQIDEPLRLVRDPDQPGRIHVETGPRPDNLDLLLVGIGSPAGGILGERLDAQDLDHRIRRRVVGDICSTAFDGEGRPLPLVHRDSVSLLDLDELHRLATRQAFVVAVAGGKEKVRPIRVALESTWVNVLLTDERTAEELAGGGTAAAG